MIQEVKMALVFAFPKLLSVICYLLSVTQKNRFWKLSTVNCNACNTNKIFNGNLSPCPPCDPWIFFGLRERKKSFGEILFKMLPTARNILGR